MGDGQAVWVGAVVTQALYLTIVVNMELSCKVKLSIYQSVYALKLTYSHELSVVTKRTRLWIQPAKTTSA